MHQAQSLPQQQKQPGQQPQQHQQQHTLLPTATNSRQQAAAPEEVQTPSLSSPHEQQTASRKSSSSSDADLPQHQQRTTDAAHTRRSPADEAPTGEAVSPGAQAPPEHQASSPQDADAHMPPADALLASQQPAGFAAPGPQTAAVPCHQGAPEQAADLPMASTDAAVSPQEQQQRRQQPEQSEIAAGQQPLQQAVGHNSIAQTTADASSTGLDLAASAEQASLQEPNAEASAAHRASSRDADSSSPRTASPQLPAHSAASNSAQLASPPSSPSPSKQSDPERASASDGGAALSTSALQEAGSDQELQTGREHISEAVSLTAAQGSMTSHTGQEGTPPAQVQQPSAEGQEPIAQGQQPSIGGPEPSSDAGRSGADAAAEQSKAAAPSTEASNLAQVLSRRQEKPSGNVPPVLGQIGDERKFGNRADAKPNSSDEVLHDHSEKSGTSDKTKAVASPQQETHTETKGLRVSGATAPVMPQQSPLSKPSPSRKPASLAGSRQASMKTRQSPEMKREQTDFNPLG